ncbi:MAG: hypothetical protein D3905_15915 [Candidatus Electrothrix sp. AS4_5]|nr:hypothetical protein [Candidatus Electrothrix gigas]
MILQKVAMSESESTTWGYSETGLLNSTFFYQFFTIFPTESFLDVYQLILLLIFVTLSAKLTGYFFTLFTP